MEHAYTLVIRDAHASLYDSTGASVMLIDTHVAIHVEPGYLPTPDGPRLIPALDVPPRSPHAHGGLWAGLDGLMQVQGYGVTLIPTGRDAYAEALTYTQAHGGTLTVRDVREAIPHEDTTEPEPEPDTVKILRKAVNDAKHTLAKYARRKSSRKCMARAHALVLNAEYAYRAARDLAENAAKLSTEGGNVPIDTPSVIVGPKGIPPHLARIPKVYETWEHRSMWHTLLGDGLTACSSAYATNPQGSSDGAMSLKVTELNGKGELTTRTYLHHC